MSCPNDLGPDDPEGSRRDLRPLARPVRAKRAHPPVERDSGRVGQGGAYKLEPLFVTLSRLVEKLLYRETWMV